MIELKIGVFSPVSNLSNDVKKGQFYGGLDIRTIEQEPNLHLKGYHYKRHALHYEPKTTF